MVLVARQEGDGQECEECLSCRRSGGEERRTGMSVLRVRVRVRVRMMSKLTDTFRGKVVNKRLSVNSGVDKFPRFVVEYLIDNYCGEESFQDDLQQVIKRLRENFVHGAEAEKIRHEIRETRNHSIIANLEARLHETEDKYGGTISAINESFVRQYPMLLSGGMWGTITLTHDETEVHNKKIRPFKVTEFTPFQISVIALA
jgi:ATP-dependent Lon protease